MDGPCTSTRRTGLLQRLSATAIVSPEGRTARTTPANDISGGTDAATTPCTPHRRLGPLRPALWRLRPRTGADRGRVGQGDLREVPGQRGSRLPDPRTVHQGAAG